MKYKNIRIGNRCIVRLEDGRVVEVQKLFDHARNVKTNEKHEVSPDAEVTL